MEENENWFVGILEAFSSLVNLNIDNEVSDEELLAVENELANTQSNEVY